MLLAFFKNEIQHELVNILNWWTENMTDHDHGGFLGRIDAHGIKYPEADKGIILNTRILWTYSKIYQKTGEVQYLDLATRACQYIIDHFWDEKYGGVFWMVDFQGAVINRQKQIYAQAFAIYALAAYYEIQPDPEIAHKVHRIFQCIEEFSRDRSESGYLNVFNVDWTLADDQKLSEKDADQVKIMNTHLHILEAYTALSLTFSNPEYRVALRDILSVYLDRFCARDPCHVYLFFDQHWNPTSREKSFGHDIESSWLITEAAEHLNDPALTLRAREISLALAEAVFLYGKDQHGGIFEQTDSSGIEIQKEKHWWPQAEAVIGFVNAWQLSGEEKYLQQAIQTWHFIQQYFIDRKNGEWHWLVDVHNNPLLNEDKAGPWKAPYHNVRMCLEVIERIEIAAAQRDL